MSLTFALQALLARHEAYMLEAEAERRKMGASIDKLELDKKELESSNAKTIEENRYLLDQLEELNNTVSSSDTQILALNTTLLSTRKELDKLTGLAEQTAQLEAQLAAMEVEQAKMQEGLASKEEGERSAVQRWKGAERTINALAEQVDRIEKEAKEERARHAEVLARFERRRAVEKELQGAAGRLKGAAAASTLGRENGSNSVVSHFVKDILQDNANLQLGIVELRDMLMGSNEEVETLREQMILHQPVVPTADGPESPSLDSELTKTPTNDALPDLHVHHHYHAAPKADSSKEKLHIRRPKKRRNITSPGLHTPGSGTQTPRTTYSPILRAAPPSSAATILSQTLVTIPPPLHPSHGYHSSVQSLHAPSSTAPSSLPSSPLWDPSVFDMDETLNSSRPTTPGSTGYSSPDFKPCHYKRGSDFSIRSLSAGPTSAAHQSISSVLRAAQEQDDFEGQQCPMLEHHSIREEPEDDISLRPTTAVALQDFDSPQDYNSILGRPRLHRANSAESLFGSRGMDIPKLHSNPSHLLGTPRTSLGTSSMSVEPVTGSTSAVAQASKSTRGYNITSYNRYLLANIASTIPPSASDPIPSEKVTLGKRLGGWVTGKWGIAPASSAGSTQAKAEAKEPFKADVRPPVIREKGSVQRVNATKRMSTHVEAVTVDSALLEESLGQG